MTQYDDLDRSLARWFEAEARPAPTSDVLDRALRATRRRRPRPGLYATLGSHWVGDSVQPGSGGASLGRTGVRSSMAVLLILLTLLALVAGAVLVGARLLEPARVDLGIFAPVAGRVVYGDEQGIWGVDPAAAADDASTRVQLRSGSGTPLGWSSDGTRLLIMRGGNLFVLDADGSEIQVTERPMSIVGATISPDGLHVVFAGAADGTGSALYAVDADGGSTEVLVTHQDGDIRAPTYAPDGTRIAYTYGAGDRGHHVWVIGADGSGAHVIVDDQRTAAAGHVRGLAWSPTGDRIALGLEGTIYTFAIDGSDFTKIAGTDATCDSPESCAVDLPNSAETPYWSPDGSKIAYTTGCVDGAGAGDRDGCHLAIANADGSNPRPFDFAASGPWHPAPVPSPDPSSVPLAAGELVLGLRSWRAELDDNEVAVYADGRVIWRADGQVGYLEQQLSTEGVERLRSRAMSTGLFGGDHALRIDGIGWGNVTVNRGDRPVTVAWGSSPEDVSGLGLEDSFVDATSAQVGVVTELDAFLRDPTTWGLPDGMFIQPEVKRFVPTHLWVGYDRSRPNLSNLPSPAREILMRALQPSVGPDCELITIAEAREMARVLAQAGIIAPDHDVRLGFAFDVPNPQAGRAPSFVHISPAMPHALTPSCGEG